MKRLTLFVMAVFYTALLFAQIPGTQHNVVLPHQQTNTKAQSKLGPVYVPGQGFLESIPNSVQQLDPNNRKYPVVRTGGASKSLVPSLQAINTPNGFYFNTVKDDRNLPLSPSGKLLNPDGLEVDFQLPNNPNDPGICATHIPVVDPEGAKVAANCPISVPCDLAANRDANIPLPADPIKFMQVRWLVVQNTTTGAGSNIDQARIDQLMAEVNADFAPFRIEFCADPATFVTDDAMYTLNVGSEDATLKTTYGTTPNNLINLYVVGNITNPSAGGYARFPYDPFGGLNIRGGVVLARGNLFVGTHTLSHELGHTFGLFHTFHGVDEVPACTNCYEGRDLVTGASSGADTEGDWCSDTNPHATNANVCGDAGTDACVPGLPWLNSPVDNHMSYSFCSSQFTPQQAGRMHCMIDTYLQNWVNFGNATCGAQPPVADFSGNPTFWQSPCNVTFTDLSVPASTITNWTWNFDVTGVGGVTPATFVGQTPPVVTYTTCDTTYTVSLTVTNPNGSDTETKVDYITVQCPAAACDTLDTQWETPTPNPTFSGFSATDFATGIPSATLNPTNIPISFFEEYITPSPGVTEVGAVRIALGNYFDSDSNTTFSVLLHNADATGFPIGAPLAGVVNINPGSDLGVPAGNIFDEFWIPFTKTVIDSPAFLVRVQIVPGNANDSLAIVSSSGGLNQGQGLGRNYVNSPSFGYLNYLADIGANFDLHLIPMLGPFEARTFITGLFQLPFCDTTLVLITDTVFTSECLTSMTVTSNAVGTLQDTNAFNLDSIFIFYTTPPPDTFTIETINQCGRTDSFSFSINYAFDTTPVPDFTVNIPNPVCAGTAIGFTATPVGMLDYTWDFGDGTVVSTGFIPNSSHTYAAPGLYYVNLTVTDPSGCTGEETKLDFIEIVDCSVNAPIAGFDIDPDSVCAGDLVTFTDTSLAVPDAATSWLWAFDDGTFSIAQNPTHTYNTPGNYNVTLIAGNSGGADTVTFPLVVLSLPCILPVGIELHANPVGNSVVLGWETPSDASQPRYTVERSLDGSNFSPIGNLNWNENTAPHLYSYIDRSPMVDRDLYYRITAVDQNGGEQFSNVVQVRLNADNDQWLNIYPNPLGEGQILQIDAFLLEKANLNINIFDALGRKVFETESLFEAGLGRLQLSTEQLPAGTYLVQVRNNNQIQVKKLLVE